MVSAPNRRWKLAGLLLGLGAPLLASCPGYNPVLADCAVHCGAMATCPQGYACKASYCRPANATGACDCKPGDQRACGGGKGVCTPGVQTCTMVGTWGQCLGEGKATGELCDNLDNDCDGQIDNDLADAPICPLKVGVCENKQQKCIDGNYVGGCDATTYGADYQTVETKCDGLDNDCDGIVDGSGMVSLMLNVVAYDLQEIDSGYVIAASELLDDGGYAAVVLITDPNLNPRGPERLLPNGAAANTQYIKATSYQGSAYIAFSDITELSDVHLVEVQPDAGLRQLGIITGGPDPGSALEGPLTIGVDDNNVLIVFVANTNPVANEPSEARLYRFPRDGGAMSKSDINPVDPLTDVYTAAVSPHGSALIWTGYDNDAGEDITISKQQVGTKTSTPPLSTPFVLEDTGNAVHAAWNENVNFSFFGIVENYSDVSYKPDIFSTAQGSHVRSFGDSTVVQATNMGHGVNGPALTWTEYNSRVAVGTPVGNGAQTRLRFFNPDAGTATAGFPDIAYCGITDMMAVTYLDGVTGIGNLYGQLVCPP